MSLPVPARFHLTLNNETETRRFGEYLAGWLQAGDVIGLCGDLGSGKTRLVKAVASQLGADPETVNSPTFSLIQEYSGRLRIRHCDTYRLRHPDEFADLGLDELFAEDGVCFVEWADRVRNDLPRSRLEIAFTATGPSTRQLVIEGSGRRGRELCLQLQGFNPVSPG